MLLLNHSATNGTTIEGDETREAKDIIKRIGLKWSPTRNAWYKLKSIGQTDKSLVEKWLNYYKFELEKSGFNCEINIEIQSQQEIDRALKSIYENRIDKYENLSVNKCVEADNLSMQASNMLKLTAGTPILIGHHSEKRHRKWLEKSENKMRNAISLYSVSKYYENKSNKYNKMLDEIDNREHIENIKNKYNEIILKIKKEAKKLLKLDQLKMTNKYAHEVWYFAKINENSLSIYLNDKCNLTIETRDNCITYENVSFENIIKYISKYLKINC